MICPDCAELRATDSGAPCPECGATLVPATGRHLEDFAQALVRRRIERWRFDGLLDRATADRLEASLHTPPADDASEPESFAFPVVGSVAVPAVDPAVRVEAWAEGVAASLRRAGGWRPGWGAALARSMDEAAKAEREQAAQQAAARKVASHDADDAHEDDLRSALGSGPALFSAGNTGALGGGLEAMVALDEGEGAPRLHEYIWWFLGAVLVLGGSLMGVREAWRALGGVPRQLLVSGALLGYHAAFIGLGAFLARRSLSAGRVLAGIGLALLPVVFIALSALVALTPIVGVPVALGAAALALLPLRSAGRLLHGTSTASIAVALFPSLLAGLPLMGWDEAPWLRALCAASGVVALGATVWRARRAAPGKALFVSAGAALYGALWLAVFAVASGPSGFDALEPGSPLFAGLTLWALALGAVVAWAASTDAVREAYPRAGPVFETLAHAVVASAALAGALGAFSVSPGDDGHVDVASACAPVLAAWVFFALEPRRRALVHTGVMAALLSGALFARILAPTEPAWWCFGVAAVSAGLMLMARTNPAQGLRNRMLAWSVVVSLATMPAVTWVSWNWGTGGFWPRAMTGLLIAVAAHVAGGWSWRGLHYVGAVAALFGALAVVAGTPELASDTASLTVFALAAGLYGLAGLVQRAWAQRTGRGDLLEPLEDVSLGLAALGVVLGLGVTPTVPDALASFAGAWGTLPVCVPTALATAVLLLRLRRERSRLVGFLAAMGLALTVTRGMGTVADFTSARAALVAAALGLGFALLAALRGRDPVADPAPRPKGRTLLGGLPLPFAARGRALLTDGFAAAAFVQAVFATVTLAGFIPAPVSAERPSFLLAGALLTALALLAFLSRGFVAYQLRGSVVTLAAGGGLIALTAVINRAGRPLPPDVVAWRLPLIGIALWALALATRRFGPWLGQRLEKPRHGPLYHHVPHLGVAALAAVLVNAAVQVGLPDFSRALGVVPPLLVLGSAVLWLLLAASYRSGPLAHLGLLLGLPGAALWAAHQSLLGAPLVSLLPPGGQWVRATAFEAFGAALHWHHPSVWLAPGDTYFLLWQRAFAGVAAAGLAYAGVALAVARLDAGRAFIRNLFSLPDEARSWRFLWALRRWSFVAVMLVASAAFAQPGLLAAGLAFATGAVLFAGGARGPGRTVLGISFLLLVHAQAHRVDFFATWPGPVLALAALAVVVLSPWVARRRGLDAGSTRVRAHLAVVPYILAALAYSLAVTSPNSSTAAVPVLLWEMLMGLGGKWMASPALPLTLALIAATLLVAAFQWRGAFAGFVAGLGAGVMGGAVVSALMVSFVMRALQFAQRPDYSDLFMSQGAALALAAAASALALHVAHRVTSRQRSDVADGMGWGRDLWLVGTGVLLAVLALGFQATEEALPLALAAIGLAVGVSLHCAWREHTGRHVYFVQVSVVGVYAMVRGLYAQGLRPEHDALFALSLGFVLVGVTVLARRAGVRPVEQATRRFAALLPIGIALMLPGDATGEAALIAGGSGLLYSALGAVERSRMFGAFAAGACNLALLIAALAFGLEGLEVYLAPLGLLLLMLGQLFTSSLPHAARNAVRILGGLLLYVPAAAKLAMRMGESEDGTYALVFGAVCLLGVAVGMALQIRAYLALGTLFLTLDVVANLLDAGLRDHRIGFLVMTLTGLTIVGGRVLATLKREEWEQLTRRVRMQLRGWD